MVKVHPKLYKETMTTEEVIEAVPTISSKIAAFKWLYRNNVSKYRIDNRTVIWDRAEVIKCLPKTPKQRIAL